MVVGRASSARTRRPYLTVNGARPRAPCEVYTERASGLARGTPPYARHSAPRDSYGGSICPPLTSRENRPSSSIFLLSGLRTVTRAHRNHRPSSWFHYECFFIVLSVLLLIGDPVGLAACSREFMTVEFVRPWTLASGTGSLGYWRPVSFFLFICFSFFVVSSSFYFLLEGEIFSFLGRVCFIEGKDN